MWIVILFIQITREGGGCEPENLEWKRKTNLFSELKIEDAMVESDGSLLTRFGFDSFHVHDFYAREMSSTKFGVSIYYLLINDRTR